MRMRPASSPLPSPCSSCVRELEAAWGRALRAAPSRSPHCVADPAPSLPQLPAPACALGWADGHALLLRPLATQQWASMALQPHNRCGRQTVPAHPAPGPAAQHGTGPAASLPRTLAIAQSRLPQCAAHAQPSLMCCACAPAPGGPWAAPALGSCPQQLGCVLETPERRRELQHVRLLERSRLPRAGECRQQHRHGQLQLVAAAAQHAGSAACRRCRLS